MAQHKQNEGSVQTLREGTGPVITENSRIKIVWRLWKLNPRELIDKSDDKKPAWFDLSADKSAWYQQLIGQKQGSSVIVFVGENSYQCIIVSVNNSESKIASESPLVATLEAVKTNQSRAMERAALSLRKPVTRQANTFRQEALVPIQNKGNTLQSSIDECIRDIWHVLDESSSGTAIESLVAIFERLESIAQANPQAKVYPASSENTALLEQLELGKLLNSAKRHPEKYGKVQNFAKNLLKQVELRDEVPVSVLSLTEQQIAHLKALDSSELQKRLQNLENAFKVSFQAVAQFNSQLAQIKDRLSTTESKPEVAKPEVDWSSFDKVQSEISQIQAGQQFLFNQVTGIMPSIQQKVYTAIEELKANEASSQQFQNELKVGPLFRMTDPRQKGLSLLTNEPEPISLPKSVTQSPATIRSLELLNKEITALKQESFGFEDKIRALFADYEMQMASYLSYAVNDFTDEFNRKVDGFKVQILHLQNQIQILHSTRRGLPSAAKASRKLSQQSLQGEYASLPGMKTEPRRRNIVIYNNPVDRKGSLPIL